jgi:virginiamycin B lyase
MGRHSFQRNPLLAALTTPVAGALWRPPSATAAVPVVPPPRETPEARLPPEQPHEIITMPGRPLVLVSHRSNSVLVKLWLDQDTGQVAGVGAFPLGLPAGMLHGLAPSSRYPGMIWATQEADNALLLVDPGSDQAGTRPRIVRSIDIPGGGRGPHCVGEYGDLLWVTLRGSGQVLAVNHTDPQQFWLYQVKSRPILVARHPDTGEFYASQDGASGILRINFETRTTSHIRAPAARGRNPLGLVAGPDGLWVVPRGTAQRGAGTFGRVNGDGEITWFRLASPEGRRARLLHIAFGPPLAQRQPSAWLLRSSTVSPNTVDAIVHVTFDETYTRLLTEEVVALPTQLCKPHRLLPPSENVLDTEFTSATVAQLVAEDGWRWVRPAAPDLREAGLPRLA